MLPAAFNERTNPQVRSTARLRSFGKLVLRYVGIALMCGYALFSIAPLLWVFANSFSTNANIIGNSVPFTFKAFIPSPLTLQGYQTLVTSGFFRAVMNTALVAVVVVVGGLLVNSAAGYAFALFKFRFKNLIFALVMLTMALPADVIAIPLYSLVNDFHWVGTYTALIIPILANGFTIFLFRQAVLGVPRSLIEAARVDGLGWFQIYARIVIPLIGGTLIGGTLILILGVWQSFLWPLLAGDTASTQMIQVAVAYFQTEHQTYWNAIFAGSVIAVAVPTVLLAVMQRHFRPSVSNTGNK